VLHVFSVFDAKVGGFGSPIFCVTSGVALRSFTTAVLDPNSDFFRYSEDYTLFRIAEWDQATGQFVNLDAPEHVVSAYVLKSTVKESGSANGI